MSEVQTEATAQDTTEAVAEETTTDANAEAAPAAHAEAKQEAKAETKDAEAKLELKLPEDSLLDDAEVARIAEYAKKRGLTQEQAQEIIEMESQTLAKFREDQINHLKKQSEEWKANLLSDKEFGGEAFKANAELAKRAAQKFATPDFIKTLEETGLGNHPELVKMFYRIGKAMSDDSFVKPGAQAASKKDIAEVLYGNNN